MKNYIFILLLFVLSACSWSSQSDTIHPSTRPESTGTSTTEPPLVNIGGGMPIMLIPCNDLQRASGSENIPCSPSTTSTTGSLPPNIDILMDGACRVYPESCTHTAGSHTGEVLSEKDREMLINAAMQVKMQNK